MGGMTGRTVVMTGATSGLGAVAAAELAARGARLVVIGRDAARVEDTLARLRTRNRAVEPVGHLADLSRLDEVKRVAATIAATEPRIDVLACNAGAIHGRREITADGLERTFATNHLAAFVLTLALQEPLEAAGGGRVVVTASSGHRAARYSPDDAEARTPYNAVRAYCVSKLCNVLFTRELARRWAPRGIVANAFHPGFVATRIGDGSLPWLQPLVRVAKLFAVPPEQGARTLIQLAAAPEAGAFSGRYLVDGRPAAPSRAAQDDEAAAALWAQSLQLAGLVR